MKFKEGFLLAFPDSSIELHTTYTSSFIGLISYSGPWVGSHFGEGIIIGMVDTGIDPSHLSFSDLKKVMPPPPSKWGGSCGFSEPKACNNKLIGAMAFFNGSHPVPLDDSGHGTHASGIAAGAAVTAANMLGQAFGVVSIGIAPGAHLGAHLAMYKVYGSGTSRSSDFIAGVDRAIKDNVDVLSISLGDSSPRQMYEELLISSFAAMKKSIIPCLSAGNNGPKAGSIVNDAPWVLTVAAATTDRRIAATIFLGDGSMAIGESGYQPMEPLPFMKMIYPGVDGNCTELLEANINVNGMIILCHYLPSVIYARKAGAVAIVLLGRNIYGTTQAIVDVLPVVTLDYPNAVILLSYFFAASNGSGSAIAEIKFYGTKFGAPNSPSVASFSSRGPSAFNGGILKPDVIGPGINIMAAWPYGVGPDTASMSSNKNLNFQSGTSVATSHLAGVTAIIRNLHPNWSPAAVKSAIMTTAYTIYADGSRIVDQKDGCPASVFAMGAGHVDPHKAVNPGLVYDIEANDYIAYLCGLHYTDEQVSALTQGIVNCASLKSISVEQLNYPSIALTLRVNLEKKKTVTRTVTNVGEAESIYQLQYVTPKEVELTITPPELVFTKVGEKKRFLIKFSISARANIRKGEVAEGELRWTRGDVTVRSPFVVSFA